ncbi:hypothetical protein BC830DRAFT_726975 [Chytriomyces sp. MP71]|nr:hypothetical protein BC830DRAFT_726975 [Chytriomyces sp. MP71]
MPANDPSTCQKDAAYMQDSYGRALLDNPNLDGCNQDVIGDLDGWHDDCYLDSSQPWMFKSPNPNYNSVQTMQSFCWSAHGVWLQLPGQPLSTPPAAVVSATTAPLPPLQQSLSSASSEAPASSTVADHPQGSADPSLTAAPMAVASDTFTTVLSSSLAPLASFAASSSALAGSSPTRIVISLPQPSNNALSANSVVMPHQDLPAQGPPIALIVGCVVGAIVLLAILCTVFMMRRRKDADPEHMMRGGSERSTARHV